MSAEIGNISERRINAEATRRGIPSAQRTNAKLILSVDLADFRVSKSQFLPEFNATVIYSVARYDDSGHAVGSFIVSGHSSSVNERTTGYHDGALSPDYFFRKAVESAVEDGMRRLFDRIESAGR